MATTVYDSVRLLNLLKDRNYDEVWNWDVLSEKIPLHIITNNAHRRWNFKIVSSRPDITIDVVRHNKLKWNFDILSKSTLITIDDILECREMPWKWDIVLARPDITIVNYKMLRLNLHPEHNPIISGNLHLNIRDILNDDYTVYWDWGVICSRPDFNLEFVKIYPAKPYKWIAISANPVISLNQIDNTPWHPWNYRTIARRSDVLGNFEHVIGAYPNLACLKYL